MTTKEPLKAVSLAQLAALVEGTVIGAATVAIEGVCALDEPRRGCISFLRETSLRKLQEVAGSVELAALIVTDNPEFRSAQVPLNLLLVKNPIAAITKILNHIQPRRPAWSGISSQAAIDPSARIGKNVVIGPFVSIAAETEIEDDVIIYPQVTIYQGVKIGRGSIIHAGAVIRESCMLGAFTVVQNGAVVGADGFGYFPDEHGCLQPVPQVGNVLLAERVEVGANACIDRATLGATRVGRNTKIDNLVQIGHNVQIGSSSILCGQVGLAGSAKIGNGVVLGGGAGVADHFEVCDGCRVGAHAAVMSSISEKGDYSGLPAIPHRRWLRNVTIFGNLSEVLKKIKKSKTEEDD